MRTFFGFLVGMVVLAANHCLAIISPFTITGTYSQGGVPDLAPTSIGLGGAGSFTLDPGFSGDYFDFTNPGGGTFSTTGLQIGGYYFLRSYAGGESIGPGNFGTDVSAFSDWDTILVNGATAGAWSGSHTGFLGFQTAANLYGYIEYDFTRSGSLSTILFLNGAYNTVPGASILAGEAEPSAVPEPSTIFLLGVGGAVAYRVRRERAKRSGYQLSGGKS